MSKENINHPKHYTTSNIECIEAMEAQMSREQFTGYLKGCVIKYIWRYEKKNNRIEDLEKANWYLQRLLKFESGEDYDIKLKVDVDIKEKIEKIVKVFDDITEGNIENLKNKVEELE